MFHHIWGFTGYCLLQKFKLTDMKRIIICCDGTWNSPGDVKNSHSIKTNVQKIFESVCNTGEDGLVQIKHYIDGIGTSGSKLRRIIDGATGWGLDNNILSAYKFLVWNFVKGDEIYLFGFSRGAYTARSVAGLIRNCGIIRNDELPLINAAYDHYRNHNDEEWRPDGVKAQEFRKKYSVESNIRFIGVWDTVGALGIPFAAFQMINREKYKFHDTQLSSSVDFAYQALAIDERRKSFDATLWKQSPKQSARTLPQVMEQRWFMGVHSNVGGGYPDSEISDIALQWMMEKAKNTQLALDAEYIEKQVHPHPGGRIYDSYVFPYNLAGPLERKISADPVYHSSIDKSVLQRMTADPDYRPKNLMHLINPDELL